MVTTEPTRNLRGEEEVCERRGEIVRDVWGGVVRVSRERERAIGEMWERRPEQLDRPHSVHFGTGLEQLCRLHAPQSKGRIRERQRPIGAKRTKKALVGRARLT